ncbi:hypothetical protein ACP70R_036689 [Stipagrostis hirtigluma subsp. patula]
MAAGILEDDETCGPVKTHPWWVERIAQAFTVAITLVLVLLLAYDIIFDFTPPEFWVKVPAVEGLGRSAGAAAAPTFNITLRVNNEGNRVWEVCGKGGGVEVEYAGVPLAHGELPDFCVPPGVVGSVPVVATSDGLGLPDALHERMQGQRRRGERVALSVRVRMHDLTGCGGSKLLLMCTGILHGQPKGPFVCPIFGKPPDRGYAVPV